MSDQKTITIQGVVVEVTQPYAEGHTVSEAEAKALNQVRAENIANNKRREIKELLDVEGATAESVQEAVQAIITAYDSDYVFTMASVGGGATRLDPLTKECRAIARNFISGKLKESGTSQKDYLAANGENAIKDKIIELADHPEIVKLAKKTLADREKMGAISL